MEHPPVLPEDLSIPAAEILLARLVLQQFVHITLHRRVRQGDRRTEDDRFVDIPAQQRLQLGIEDPAVRENIGPDHLVAADAYESHDRAVRILKMLQEESKVFVVDLDIFFILVARQVRRGIVLEIAFLQLPVHLPPDQHLVLRRVEHLAQMGVGEIPVGELFLLIAPSSFLHAHGRDILVLLGRGQDGVPRDHPVLSSPGNDLPRCDIHRFVRVVVDPQPMHIVDGSRAALGHRHQPLPQGLAQRYDILLGRLLFAAARLPADGDDL